jgi:heat shock protein HspQ
MAIELVGSGKVLLFPADAQVGNWLSWDAIKPELVADDGKKVAAADLLRRTVFYKVGHHGSHNATMRETGLERMVSQELVAFVPVDERVAHEVRNWRDMPFEPLLAQLYEKTRGRVIRLDQGVVTDARPHFLAEDVWQQLAATARTFRDERLQTGGQFPSANGGQDPLYYQLAITDDEGRS